MQIKSPVPFVRPRQAIRADTWNRMAGAVNGALAAPQDLDAGAVSDLVSSRRLVKIGEDTETVRVENPDDDTQFVDVERVLRLRMLDTSTGRVEEWDL